MHGASDTDCTESPIHILVWFVEVCLVRPFVFVSIYFMFHLMLSLYIEILLCFVCMFRNSSLMRSYNDKFLLMVFDHL